MKRIWIALAIVVSAVLLNATILVANSTLFKSVAAIGALSVTEELDIDDIRVVGANTLRLEVVSNANTQADSPYLGTLRINDLIQGATSVEFSAAEIPGTTKLVDFPIQLVGGADIAVEFLSP